MHSYSAFILHKSRVIVSGIMQMMTRVGYSESRIIRRLKALADRARSAFGMPVRLKPSPAVCAA